MTLKRVLSGALTLILVVLVVAMLAGQILGQPVLLGYVTSGSMEPTISEGDGYVVIPSFVTETPQEGDIVVYDAREFEGGGLTTHRIVGEQRGGYVTKGDANPFTDQDSDEPPVTNGQIVGVLPQPGGEPITIPYLGTVVGGIQGVIKIPVERLGVGNASSALVFLGIGLLVLAGLTGEGRDTRRSRERGNVVSSRLLAAVAVVIVVGAATVGMVMPAGVYEFGVIATSDPASASEEVEPGGSTEFTYRTNNGGLIPAMVIVDPASDGVTTSPGRAILTGGEETEVTVTARAPPEEGRYVRSIHESRYIVVLPPGLIAALHQVHPLLALAAVDAVVALFVLGIFLAYFGTGMVRYRSGPDHVPASTRLRRRLRRFRW